MARTTAGRTAHIRLAALGALTAGLLALAAVVPLSSVAEPSLGQLGSALSQQQARAASLSASVSSLNSLIGSLSSQIAVVRQREAAVQAELIQDRAQLAQVSDALVRKRRLLRILVARLARARAILARQLVSGYESDNPDLVSIVLEARGFSDLLDRIEFLRTAERQQNATIAFTRSAKAQADGAAHRLATLETTDRAVTASAATRVQALAGMNSLLQSRQGALQAARAAQAAALAAARKRGQALQAEISQVQAQQAAARRAAASSPNLPTPAAFGNSAGGGWAIPSSIVACESGGQNLTPNGAGASGYYQIVPDTWKQYGGSGPAAYLAPKSVQDAVASRIWGGGSGASSWTCAGMVGGH
jgi:septal ring factor EnvC (AmiA/AmiB activator)